jgi:hypothetical protein
MGRNAAGVYAVKLASGDRLIHMDVVEEGGALLVLSEKGYAKRTSLRSYPTQSRYTRGVATYASISSHTGRLAAASVVGDDESVGILSAAGRAFRLQASDIPQQGRSTRGRAVVELRTTDRVAAVVRAPAKPRKPSSTTRTRARKKGTTSRKRPTRARATPKKAAAAGKASSTGERKRSSTRSSRSRKQQRKS